MKRFLAMGQRLTVADITMPSERSVPNALTLISLKNHCY